MKVKSYKKPVVAASLLATAAVHAAETETVVTAVTKEPTSNGMLYLLLATCAILLVAVLLLGRVLVQLTTIALSKNKSKTAAMAVLLLTANTAFAQSAGNSTGVQQWLSYDMMMGIVVLVAELLVVFWMLWRINALLTEISDTPQKESSFKLHLPKLFDNINASVAIEKEKDIMLDHDYDGIRELDNSLPPWWKYSFYISIIWSFIYMGYYHFGEGPGSIDEFNAEMQQAKVEVEEYNRKNALNVDENNVQLAEGPGILDGQEIFKTNCAACHGNLGEGNVGPNLTDDYWMHGGSLAEVFKSVKYGWPAKGMKSWQSDLSPVQIKNVTSYIHSLHGTKPANAKGPEGVLYNMSARTTADTTVIDSLAVAQGDTLKK